MVPAPSFLLNYYRWYEDIEITPNNNSNFYNFEFIEDGILRALRVKDCPMSAAGKYKCTTKYVLSKGARW